MLRRLRNREREEWKGWTRDESVKGNEVDGAKWKKIENRSWEWREMKMQCLPVVKEKGKSNKEGKETNY